MIKLLLTLTYHQYQELNDHLYYNGYHYNLNYEYDMALLEIDAEEADYVKTILRERGIGICINT